MPPTRWQSSSGSRSALVAVGLGVALRTLDPSSGSPTRTVRGSRLPVTEVADVVVGTAWGAARVTGRLAVTGGRVAGPVVSVVLRPPLVPRRLQPGRGVAAAGGAVASRPPGHRAVARAVVGDHAALRHPGGHASGGRPGLRRRGARRRRPRRRRCRRGPAAGRRRRGCRRGPAAGRRCRRGAGAGAAGPGCGESRPRSTSSTSTSWSSTGSTSAG